MCPTHDVKPASRIESEVGRVDEVFSEDSEPEFRGDGPSFSVRSRSDGGLFSNLTGLYTYEYRWGFDEAIEETSTPVEGAPSCSDEATLRDPIGQPGGGMRSMPYDATWRLDYALPGFLRNDLFLELGESNTDTVDVRIHNADIDPFHFIHEGLVDCDRASELAERGLEMHDVHVTGQNTIATVGDATALALKMLEIPGWAIEDVLGYDRPAFQSLFHRTSLMEPWLDVALNPAGRSRFTEPTASTTRLLDDEGVYAFINEWLDSPTALTNVYEMLRIMAGVSELARKMLGNLLDGFERCLVEASQVSGGQTDRLRTLLTSLNLASIEADPEDGSFEATDERVLGIVAKAHFQQALLPLLNGQFNVVAELEALMTVPDIATEVVAARAANNDVQLRRSRVEVAFHEILEWGGEGDAEASPHVKAQLLILLIEHLNEPLGGIARTADNLTILSGFSLGLLDVETSIAEMDGSAFNEPLERLRELVRAASAGSRDSVLDIQVLAGLLNNPVTGDEDGGDWADRLGSLTVALQTLLGHSSVEANAETGRAVATRQDRENHRDSELDNLLNTLADLADYQEQKILRAINFVAAEREQELGELIERRISDCATDATTITSLHADVGKRGGTQQVLNYLKRGGAAIGLLGEGVAPAAQVLTAIPAMISPALATIGFGLKAILDFVGDDTTEAFAGLRTEFSTTAVTLIASQRTQMISNVEHEVSTQRALAAAGMLFSSADVADDLETMLTTMSSMSLDGDLIDLTDDTLFSVAQLSGINVQLQGQPRISQTVVDDLVRAAMAHWGRDMLLELSQRLTDIDGDC